MTFYFTFLSENFKLVVDNTVFVQTCNHTQIKANMASSFKRITRLLPIKHQHSLIHNRSLLNRMNPLNKSLSSISILPSQQKRKFSEQTKAARMQTFSVYRWDPNDSTPPKEVEYQVDVSDCPMILDVLIKIKNQQDTV